MVNVWDKSDPDLDLRLVITGSDRIGHIGSTDGYKTPLEAVISRFPPKSRSKRHEEPVIGGPSSMDAPDRALGLPGTPSKPHAS